MIRKFCALLVFAGLGIAIAGMACTETQKTLDKADEGDGGT